MDSGVKVLTVNSGKLGHPETGSRLREIREERGLSRRYIAEKLGVTVAAVQDYERSEAAGKITLTTLNKYAAVLDSEVNITITPRASVPAAESNSSSPQPVRRRRKANPAPAKSPDFESHSFLPDRMGLWSAPVND